MSSSGRTPLEDRRVTTGGATYTSPGQGHDLSPAEIGTEFGDKRVFVATVTCHILPNREDRPIFKQNEDEKKPPTDVVTRGPTKKSGLYVTCGDGSVLELITVQPATRKAFPAKDFQNGYPGKTIRWVRPPPPPETVNKSS